MSPLKIPRCSNPKKTVHESTPSKYSLKSTGINWYIPYLNISKLSRVKINTEPCETFLRLHETQKLFFPFSFLSVFLDGLAKVFYLFHQLLPTTPVTSAGFI